MNEDLRRLYIALNPSNDWLKKDREMVVKNKDNPKARLFLLTSPQEDNTPRKRPSW